jgi:zinc protease
VIPTQEQLNNIQQERIYDFYNSLYQHIDGYAFFFVGNVDTIMLKSCVARYIASIPKQDISTTWKDVTPGFPDGVSKVTVYKGTEPQSQVAIIMKGECKYDFTSNLVLKTLGKVLDIKLRERIREEESGTYGISIYPYMSKYPRETYSINVNFGCSPENVDKLVAAVFDEFKKIMDNGPLDKDMEKARETFIRERETNMKENRFWINSLDDLYFLGEKIMPEQKYNEAVKGVTAKQVQKAANKYITPDHYVLGILMPEKTASGAEDSKD